MNQVSNNEPLIGFNVAYDCAVNGDNGWRGVKSEDAFAEMEDIKNRAVSLKSLDVFCEYEQNTSYTYCHSAVTGDLIRGTRGLNIDTPELGLKVLKMQKELFSGVDDVGYRSLLAYPTYRLETYNKSTRFLGDKKVAETYLNAALSEMKRVSSVSSFYGDEAEILLQTRKKFDDIAKLHPDLAAAAKQYPLTEEDKKILAERDKQRTEEIAKQVKSLSQDSDKRNSTPHAEKTIRKFDLKNIKDKAKDFIKGSKAYAAGKGLFAECRKAAIDSWNNPASPFKEIYQKNVQALKQHPKEAVVAGAIAMFAGMGTANPALAAAGASILTAGVLALSKNKEKTENKVNIQKMNLMNRRNGR